MNPNLTEPPEVDEPSTRRLDELRSALVAYATQDVRPKRRTWVPVVAAVGAVAAIAAAAVVVSRFTSSDATPPFATSPSPTHKATKPAAGPTLPRLTPLVKVPAPGVSLDLGPATEAEAHEMLKLCIASTAGDAGFTPADAAAATIRLARWTVLPVADDGRSGPGSGRQLVVTAVRADGKAVTNCVEKNGVARSVTGSMGGSSYGSGLQMPINGGGTTTDSAENGRWTLRGVTPFDVIAGVARVDMRLTWRGGAGPWQTTVLVGRTGFADLAATGTGAKRVDAKTEVRLVDADGYLIFHAFTGVGSPVATR